MQGILKATGAVLLAALLGALPARALADAAGEGGDSASAVTVAATAINVSGDVKVQEGEDWTPVEEGQLFTQGDRLQTGDDSTLHLVLADGSSVALGPNSEITLSSVGSGDPGSVTLLSLARGLLNTMVEKLKAGSSFEIETNSAVAAVKGTDFEVSAGISGGDSSITVNEGVVQAGDPGRDHFEPVHPNERRRIVENRVLAAETLSESERAEFHNRWAGAHRLHAQRRELMARFGRNPALRRRFLQKLDRRRAFIRARPGARNGFGGPRRRDGQGAFQRRRENGFAGRPQTRPQARPQGRPQAGQHPPRKELTKKKRPNN
jgi:hypothetical protein